MTTRPDGEQLEQIVARGTWTEAKTYRDKAPHEYVVRGKTISVDDFSALALAIKDHGYMARWEAVSGRSKGRIFKSRYLVIGQHRYWWMSSIINRAPLHAETDMQREDRLAAG